MFCIVKYRKEIDKLKKYLQKKDGKSSSNSNQNYKSSQGKNNNIQNNNIEVSPSNIKNNANINNTTKGKNKNSSLQKCKNFILSEVVVGFPNYFCEVGGLTVQTMYKKHALVFASIIF